MDALTIRAPSALETAISLHVYGTDLTRVGSSARRCHEPANAEK